MVSTDRVDYNRLFPLVDCSHPARSYLHEQGISNVLKWLQQGVQSLSLLRDQEILSTKEVEFMAMSNYKPALGRVTYEIMDIEVRKKLEQLTREFLEL